MSPWFSLFFFGWVFVMQPEGEKAPISSAGPAFAPVFGRLSGIVFGAIDDAPLAGVVIRVQGVGEVVSDEDGAFVLTLPAGQHELTILDQYGESFTTDPVPVVAGETTEVLVSLGPDGSPPKLDVESSGESTPGVVVQLAEDVATGSVEGTVVHVDKQTPVADARVFVKGFLVEGRTDEYGTFEIQVPVGTHQVTVVHHEYSTFTMPEVVVREGEVTRVSFELSPASVQLLDFFVSVPHIEGGTSALIEHKQQSGSVVDVIGAEQMAKSGDSDAAGALKRVTGVTVIGGKYIYVRGLGERYSSTLLNGSTLPSPEPERRVVPLDMFPADLLESLVIQKTYSPDMPGEFGGGVVQITTKSYPEELSVKLSLSTGLALGTTFAKGLMYEGGKLDWLGIDDKTRKLPGIVARASQDQPLNLRDMFSPNGYSAEDLEKFGEAMPNVYTPHRKLVPPDLGFTASVGDSFGIKDATAGYLVSLVYKNEWDINEEHRVFTKQSGGEVQPRHIYDFESLTNTITLAGVLTFGIDINENHKLKLVSLLDRITDNESRIYGGENTDLGGFIEVTRLRWVERMLFAQQVQGVHVFSGAWNLELDWRYTFSLATRIEPDTRETRYDLEEAQDPGDEDVWYMSDRPEGNQRFFSDLMDVNHDLSIDLTLPFLQWTGEDARASIGFSSMFKEREVDTRRYKFKIDGMSAALRSLPPEEIFSPENITTDFYLMEYTRKTDNYTAGQMLLAGYTMVDLPLGAGLRLLGGVRFEHSDQNVETFELFNPEGEVISASLVTHDWLPAAALTWVLPKGHQLRIGFSRTVSRPDFRELSPATFNDVTGGRQVFGNPDLMRAIITNVDLRWEWYFAPGEGLSVAVFYKNFEDPIEQVVKIAAEHTITWENAKGANNVGVEVELRKSFDFMHARLADLYIAFNATLVFSRIQLGDTEGDIQTSNKRPLQGQSPWVFNVQLGYDNVDIGTTVVLLYNVFGPRISDVGALGLPDVYEQPFHQVDLVYRQKLAHGFGIGFKAHNILDLPIIFKQGNITVLSGHSGRQFSLSVSKTF